MSDSLERLKQEAREAVLARHTRQVELGQRAANIASYSLRYTADVNRYLELALDRLALDGITPYQPQGGTQEVSGVELNYPLEKLRAAASSAQWLSRFLAEAVTELEANHND